MPRTILDPATLAAWQSASSQTGQIAALTSPFGGGNMTVRYMAGGTIAETATHGAPVNAGGTPRGAEPGALLASTVNVSGATITHAIWRTAGGVDIMQIDAADLALASPTTQTGRRINAADAVRPKMRVTSDAGLPVDPPAPVVPTTATLSGSTSATTAVAQTYTVTLDVAADQAYTITWTRSDSGTGPATSVITAGQTSVSASSTWAAAGSGRTVDFTISPTLTRAGRPVTVAVSDPPAGFAWSISDATTLNTGRNTTTDLATGVPVGAIVEATPGLLPGQTFAQVGGVLSLVGDSTVPTVSPTATDPVLAAIAGNRFTSIEVMDGPMATIRNVTKDITYAYAAPGSWPQYDGQTSNRWNAVWGQMDPGDVIEISPGAVQAEAADASHYASNSLDSCGLHILKSGTFRNMAGRGRWRVWPASVTPANNRNGIGIFSPADTGLGRGTFVIEGFDLTDQFLTYAAGVRIRSSSGPGTWLGHHAALTLRNFKIGRTTGGSLSGVSGTTELLTMEDGHIFDCGNGSGQEHNVYAGGRVVTMRGMRFNRTRGWVGTPWAGGAVSLEGHILKVSAVTGVLEGCSVDCAALGDQSLLLQMKAGGNWTVRGNIFRDSQAPNNANGAILMCREYAMDGVTQNFEWWAGSEGNSLLFEKNVYIGHYPRPPIFFYSQASVSAMRPASGGAWSAAERLDSLTVRDNIAMVATAQPYGAWMLGGFPGADNAMWINQDPNAGANWGDRGNTAMTYGTDEPGFSDDEKALLTYRLATGPIAASGSVTTQRFLYPHGFIDRTDAFRGLA